MSRLNSKKRFRDFRNRYKLRKAIANHKNFEHLIPDDLKAAIYRASSNHDSFTSDPWRCDYCDYPCNCDERNSELLVDDILREFPKYAFMSSEIGYLVRHF